MTLFNLYNKSYLIGEEDLGGGGGCLHLLFPNMMSFEFIQREVL